MKSQGLSGGVTVLYFVIALEVLIMISPFAAFFYAAFNPVPALPCARWAATRWLAAFFLPHMVLPPGLFLKAVRVAGSVLFVGGALVFLACAAQVYFHKLLRRGPALGGLYRWIRHPQYLALALTGLGSGHPVAAVSDHRAVDGDGRAVRISWRGTRSEGC